MIGVWRELKRGGGCFERIEVDCERVDEVGCRGLRFSRAAAA